MQEHADYFRAAVPEPVRIFGIQLLPLSITRYRLLHRFGCKFVADDEHDATIATMETTMEDLVVGILVCSMPVKELLAFLDSDQFETELARWGERIRKEIATDKYFSLHSKFGLFKFYIEESSRIPKYWEETETSGGGGSHWSQNLEVTLRSDLGYTSEEIDEGPLSKAILDYFKHAENQGLIRLIAEGEESEGLANTALLEKMMKGGTCPASN